MAAALRDADPAAGHGVPGPPAEWIPTTWFPIDDSCVDRAYVYFGSYGLLCYDLEGRELWDRPIPTPKSLYGTSQSPIVHGDLLILVIDSDANLPGSRLSQSKIIALNKSTGELVWETLRPFHRSGWSTPTIWTHEGGQELVVLGNGRLRGYHAATPAVDARAVYVRTETQLFAFRSE